MKANIYEDAGCCWNDPVSFITTEHMKSCYDASTWALTVFGVRTDIASNCYCRAPGKFHSISHRGKKKYTLISFHFIYILYICIYNIHFEGEIKLLSSTKFFYIIFVIHHCFYGFTSNIAGTVTEILQIKGRSY
jgi:hypothetical protein